MGRKNSWQLAEHVGHRTPAGLQHLLSRACWVPDEIRDDLQVYVAEKLGDPAGVLIIDDTGFIKKGTVSAGVQRQYSGTAGRTENCQIGVLAAYPTAGGPGTVPVEVLDVRSGPCVQAKIPDGRGLATMGDLAKTIIMRALVSPLPIAWVTADSAYGQEWRLRRMLEEAGVGYVLSVPKSQHVRAIGRIDLAIAQAPEDAWERHSCGAGAKGPRVYDWAAARMPAIDDFDGDCDRGGVLGREERVRPGPVRGPPVPGLVQAHHPGRVPGMTAGQVMTIGSQVGA
ncbi:IS701 family transposase [Streptomyces qinglanensis]|uniref:IS701 family transposase n=1 Tax=Streptomyces qinglanensis TaxID=943816 RepID=UPI0037BD4BCB